MKLTPKVIIDLHAACDAVRWEIEDMRQQWEDRTDKWQESDAGTSAQERIDELENCIDTIYDQIDEIGGSECIKQ
jgi:hypothetical protein